MAVPGLVSCSSDTAVGIAKDTYPLSHSLWWRRKLGAPKVEHLDPASVGHKDVRRFDVSMHNSRCMGCIQGGNLVQMSDD
jgi:hypothetical protein